MTPVSERDGQSAKSSSRDVGVDATVSPVRFRGGGFQPRTVRFLGLGVFVALLVLWEIGSATGVISALVMPAPTEALAVFGDLWRSGDLWRHLSASLQRLLIGFTCGAILGLIIGTAIGLNSIVRSGLTPLVSAIFPIPKIALLPLFIVWFGIGEGSKVATILFGAFFPQSLPRTAASTMSTAR